jgi:putative FmdB family regulatory protein
MPIYEYSCATCGREFELKQRITEPPVQTCVACHADTAQRRISRPSFVLKGGGWYADGYASTGAKAAAPPGDSGA